MPSSGGSTHGGRSFGIFPSPSARKKRGYLSGSHPSASAHRPHPRPSGRFQKGGVESTNLGLIGLIGTPLKLVMRRTSAAPTSRRCASHDPAAAPPPTRTAQQRHTRSRGCATAWRYKWTADVESAARSLLDVSRRESQRNWPIATISTAYGVAVSCLSRARARSLSRSPYTRPNAPASCRNVVARRWCSTLHNADYRDLRTELRYSGVATY